jgi:methionyl-tRNA synthetase
MKEKEFFVTTPIYYLNGEPHLGHYYATTIADVLARYHRQFSSGAFFLTGTDEHGQKVADAAQKNNLSPQEYTDKMSKIWQDSWDKLGLSYDYFIRTTNPVHKALCQFVITKLLENDAVYPHSYEALYCVGDESFVTQSELREGGLCPYHDEKPQIILEKNYFFRLTKYKNRVRELIENNTIQIIPESRKNEALELLKNPDVVDFSVTREKVSWGIPVPFDTTQTLYVWIDALFNYMSGIIASKNINISNLYIDEILEKIQDIWAPDLQVLGKDIMKFHTIFWPAFLLAIGVPEDKLPKTMLITGFLLSGGRKMSKSIGNVIVPKDIIEEFNQITDNLGNDILRYVILREMKIGNDGDITKEKIMSVYDSELVNKFGNTFSRVVGMAKKYDIKLFFELPDFIDDTEKIQSLINLGLNDTSKFDIEIDSLLSSKSISSESLYGFYKNSMEQNDIYGAIKIIFLMITNVGREIEITKPWELYKSGQKLELEQNIKKWLQDLALITEVISPIMPSTSILMQKLLNGEELQIFPRLNQK